MLKRLVTIVVTAFALIGIAHATPATAENWGTQASALYAETVDLLENIKAGNQTNLEESYVAGLTKFSIVAGRLAVWVDETGGAKDFGCIYRGMAQEAELQLYALEDARTDDTASAALARIAAMLDDAQSIAVASAHAARTGSSDASPTHCPASAIALDQYIEQETK